MAFLWFQLNDWVFQRCWNSSVLFQYSVCSAISVHVIVPSVTTFSQALWCFTLCMHSLLFGQIWKGIFMQMSGAPCLCSSLLSDMLVFKFWPPEQPWICSLFALPWETSAFCLDSSSLCCNLKNAPKQNDEENLCVYLFWRIKTPVLSLLYKVWNQLIFIFCLNSQLFMMGELFQYPITDHSQGEKVCSLDLAVGMFLETRWLSGS